MRASRILLLAITCAVVFAVEPFTEGHHTKVPCAGNGDWTYDIYLPSGYDSAPDRRFPTLFLSSPVGNPSTRGLHEWADRRGFLVVAINDSANKISWETIAAIQDDVLASVDARARMHEHLRYASGFSGGAWAGVRMAMRHPEHFAGVQINIHSGNGDYAPPHCAIGFYAGINDKTHRWDHVQVAIAHYRSQGNPVRVETHDGGHKAPSDQQLIPFIDWMYWQTVVAHPQLTREERQAGLALIETEAERLAGLEEAAARVEGQRSLLDVREVSASDLGDELRAAWHDGVVAQADAAGNPLAEHGILTAFSEDEQFPGLPSKQRRAIGKRLAELRKESPVKEEWIAYRALQKVRSMEAEMGQRAKRIEQVVRAYQTIADRYPETAAGREAKAEAKRVAEQSR